MMAGRRLRCAGGTMRFPAPGPLIITLYARFLAMARWPMLPSTFMMAFAMIMGACAKNFASMFFRDDFRRFRFSYAGSPLSAIISRRRFAAPH